MALAVWDSAEALALVGAAPQALPSALVVAAAVAVAPAVAPLALALAIPAAMFSSSSKRFWCFGD